jgi:hypothetical protein
MEEVFGFDVFYPLCRLGGFCHLAVVSDYRWRGLFAEAETLTYLW